MSERNQSLGERLFWPFKTATFRTVKRYGQFGDGEHYLKEKKNSTKNQGVQFDVFDLFTLGMKDAKPDEIKLAKDRAGKIFCSIADKYEKFCEQYTEVTLDNIERVLLYCSDQLRDELIDRLLDLGNFLLKEDQQGFFKRELIEIIDNKWFPIIYEEFQKFEETQTDDN